MVDVANESCASEQVAGAASAATDPGEPLDSRIIPRKFSDDLASLAPAIVFACIGYAVLFSIGFVIFDVILYEANAVTADVLGEALEIIIAAILFSTTVGIVWCGVAAFVVMILTWYFVRSLQLCPSWTRLGMFVGGLVGCIAIVPFMGVLDDVGGLVAGAVVVMLGPGLMTVAGQLGGAWGVAVMKPRAAMTKTPPQSGRFQFGVRQMLVACIWVALLLTGVRLVGLETVPVLLALCVWLVYQAGTMWLVGRLMCWYQGWKARRKSRST